MSSLSDSSPNLLYPYAIAFQMLTVLNHLECLMSEPYAISLKTTFQYMQCDLSRYRVTEKRSYPALFVMCPGLIAGLYYRIGHWIWYADMNPNYKSLLRFLRPFYMVGKRLVEIYSGISISTQARIGCGLYINHFGSIFVGASIIGENCNLSHEVTIGVAGRGEKRGLPVVGDRVYFGAGAKVVGLVTIGNDVAIGANAVVTHDLADCAVAVGAPAAVISYKGSFDFVLYENMLDDPKRIESLHDRDLWEHAASGLEARKKVQL